MSATNGYARGESAQPRKTFLEFFSGIGLVDEGLRPSGWRCVYANDSSELKKEMYESRNGANGIYHLEDVTNTDAIVERIPGHAFLATASFPCVDLSLAGNYRGLSGRHSSTFFGFVNALQKLGERRPNLVLLENVLGFVTSRNGDDLRSALAALGELGYWFDVFVLNASHFLPQSRPRVFVIGMAEDMRPASTNPGLWGTVTPTNTPSKLRPPAVLRTLERVPGPAGWWPLALPNPPTRTVRLAEVIDVDDEQEWWDLTQVKRHYQMMSQLHKNQVNKLLKKKENFVGTIFRRVRHGSQKAELRSDGLAGCLRTPKGGSGKQIVLVTERGKLRMRWMSPREYARLQGAPDFPLELSKNQLLYGFADAVCVPAITWIDRHVLTPIYDRWASTSSTEVSSLQWSLGNSSRMSEGIRTNISIVIRPPESPRAIPQD